MEGRWIVGYQLFSHQMTLVRRRQVHYTVLVALMKSSVDYSLRLDLSVSSCSIVDRYLSTIL